MSEAILCNYDHGGIRAEAGVSHIGVDPLLGVCSMIGRIEVFLVILAVCRELRRQKIDELLAGVHSDYRYDSRHNLHYGHYQHEDGQKMWSKIEVALAMVEEEEKKQVAC